ncbi:MAG: HAD family hydrolase [Deltaproteobacteria bacterium]|nr:HAD family hydrolase [Deltaproteobacteria bacterium]
MTPLKLVIFDCDGVMFDSMDANRIYYNHLLEKFGHPAMDEEEENYVHSHNVFDSVNHIFRNYPGEIEDAHKYRVTVDYTPFLKYMVIEPDLKEFLNFLKPKFFTAISTNRTTTMPAVMKMHDLEPYFDMVVTALDVQQPKPHSEALVKILDHFELSADEAVYIGDSMVDREHTAGVNMRLISFKNPELPAEYHVNSFLDIPQLPVFQELHR